MARTLIPSNNKVLKQPRSVQRLKISKGTRDSSFYKNPGARNDKWERQSTIQLNSQKQDKLHEMTIQTSIKTNSKDENLQKLL